MNSGPNSLKGVVSAEKYILLQKYKNKQVKLMYTLLCLCSNLHFMGQKESQDIKRA